MGDAALLREQPGVCHVEQVVTRDSDAHGIRALRGECPVEHALVVRVALLFRPPGRKRPVVHGRVDLLHCEVGALDDANLDARSAVAPPRCRPPGEPLQRRERIGQVRLQHDAGVEAVQLRLVEQLLEDGDGEVEVFELLHVEVDELRGGGCRGQLVQRSQPLHDLRHHLVESPHRELARHGRDLDRDIVHVVAREQLAGSLQSAIRLIITEHGFSEQVQVEPGALAAQGVESLGELLRRGIHDKVRHHPPKHPARDRDDRPRREQGESAARHDGGAKVPGQESGDAVAELLEVAAGDPEVVRAHDPVDESDREREALRVFEHSRQPLCAGVWLHLGALGEPAAHRGDRLIREVCMAGARVRMLE